MQPITFSIVTSETLWSDDELEPEDSQLAYDIAQGIAHKHLGTELVNGGSESLTDKHTGVQVINYVNALRNEFGDTSHTITWEGYTLIGQHVRIDRHVDHFDDPEEIVAEMTAAITHLCTNEVEVTVDLWGTVILLEGPND